MCSKYVCACLVSVRPFIFDSNLIPFRVTRNCDSCERNAKFTRVSIKNKTISIGLWSSGDVGVHLIWMYNLCWMAAAACVKWAIYFVLFSSFDSNSQTRGGRSLSDRRTIRCSRMWFVCCFLSFVRYAGRHWPFRFIMNARKLRTDKHDVKRFKVSPGDTHFVQSA